MTSGLDIFAQTIVTGNLILVQGLGLYALTRYTKSVKDAAWSGLTTFVAMLIGGGMLWLFQNLKPMSLSVEVGFYLIVGLLGAIAAQKIVGKGVRYEEALIDSALVGLLLLMGRDGVTGVSNLFMAFGAGLGYVVTLIVMAKIRERLELAPVPKALEGIPILLISAGLLAIALLGFRF